MSGLLLDTHVWLWFLAGDRRLAKPIRTLIEDGERCLSAISVWEAALLHDRGRIELGAPFREWLSEARRRLPTLDQPITREIAVRSRELELPHDDPADRFLAATAVSRGLALVTADRRLLAAKWLPTVSAR